MWAAVLGARPGAVLCHQTAAELHGLIDLAKGGAIHVMVARGHTVAPMRGVVVQAPDDAPRPHAAPGRAVSASTDKGR